MPGSNKFKTIYSNDSLKEYEKYWLYIYLLQLNDEFVKDVDRLRKKYSIVIDEPVNNIDTIEPRLQALIDDNQFVEDVRVVAHKIKLQGKWTDGLALYVIGYSPQDSLYPDLGMHRIEAKAVLDDDEPHVVLKIYGDLPRIELQEATKQIRKFIETDMNYQSVNEMKDKTLMKLLTVHRFRQAGLGFKQITEKLDNLGYDIQSYSDIRRQYADYKKYAERLY